jgi:transcriptional regulator with XRE-family HTH domain
LTESIGSRIKALRTQHGLTLAELGARTGLSTSYLSQVERDKTAPSLPALTEIARALDVHPRHFFAIDSEAACIVRAEHGLNGSALERPLDRQNLTPDGTGNRLAVRRLVLGPQTPPETSAPFQGEELVFVMTGELTLVVGGETIRLAEGDSIHYDAMQPRSWSSEGDEPCTVIVGRAVSPIDRA